MYYEKITSINNYQHAKSLPIFLKNCECHMNPILLLVSHLFFASNLKLQKKKKNALKMTNELK